MKESLATRVAMAIEAGLDSTISGPKEKEQDVR